MIRALGEKLTYFKGFNPAYFDFEDRYPPVGEENILKGTHPCYDLRGGGISLEFLSVLFDQVLGLCNLPPLLIP